MAFEIKGKIGYDGSGWTSGLRQLEGETRAAGSRISDSLASAFGGINAGPGGWVSKAMGALGLGAITEQLKSAADEFSSKIKEIKIGSIRTGLDPETFQRWSNIAQAAGASYENLAHAMERIAVLQETIKGQSGKELEKTLTQTAALGVSFSDLTSKKPQEIFKQIWGFMNGSEITGSRVAAVHEVFGRAGGELIPFFKRDPNSIIGEKGLINQGALDEYSASKKSQESIEVGVSKINQWYVQQAAKLWRIFSRLPVTLIPGPNLDWAAKSTGSQTTNAGTKVDTAKLEAQALKESDLAVWNAQEAASRELALKAQPQLQEQVDNIKREAELSKLSKAKQIERVQLEKLAARKEMENAEPMDEYDPVAKNAYLSASLKYYKLDKQLSGMMSKAGGSDPMVYDSLAKIGGFGTGSTGWVKLEQLSERTANATEEIARNTKESELDGY